VKDLFTFFGENFLALLRAMIQRVRIGGLVKKNHIGPKHHHVFDGYFGAKSSLELCESEPQCFLWRVVGSTALKGQKRRSSLGISYESFNRGAFRLRLNEVWESRERGLILQRLLTKMYGGRERYLAIAVLLAGCQLLNTNRIKSQHFGMGLRKEQVDYAQMSLIRTRR
jgi:hypothetical protein